MSCYKVRRALKLKKGQFDTLIEEPVDNATYGGELRIYFNAGFNELVTNDNGKDFRTIRFHGDVIIAVANSFNGSGYHISLPLDITFPFVRGQTVRRLTGTLFLCNRSMRNVQGLVRLHQLGN